MSITKSLKDLIAAFGGSAAAVPNRIDKLIGKLADVVEAGGSGGGGGGGSDVIRVPFTLTIDGETGAVTGSTTASIADADAAMAAGKILIADAAIDAGSFGVQHLCTVMTGTVGVSGSGGSAFKFAVPLISDNGDKLELYAIAWTADGVAVVSRKAAVTEE